LADGLASLDWVRVLGRYARWINPLLGKNLSSRVPCHGR
jgi:hypothetical protein